MIPGYVGPDHRKIHNGALDGYEKRCESFMKLFRQLALGFMISGLDFVERSMERIFPIALPDCGFCETGIRM